MPVHLGGVHSPGHLARGVQGQVAQLDPRYPVQERPTVGLVETRPMPAVVDFAKQTPYETDAVETIAASQRFDTEET